MAKIDKSQYSKAEWKLIKEQRKREKEAKAEQEKSPAPLVSEPVEETKNYVLCLKHGIKYGPEYVNTLYKMVKRNLTIPFEMVCLTDDPKGVDPGIKILDLPGNLEGWWCKPYMFSANLPIKGNILYMDLDVVIAGNLDKLFTFQPNNWCVIRDFTKVMRPQWKGYNSSVIRFKTGQLDHVWTRFIKDHHRIARRHHGDQDWLYEADKSAMYWPDKWIMSWKWEIRRDRTFAPGGTKGNRKLNKIENVRPPKDCCITVFHGDPNPHNCQDPWVVDNWK